MSCEWQRGMLVMRACGAPASAGCSVCGRALCAAHAVPGHSGAACPDCAATRPGAYDATADVEFAETRRQYFMPYGGAARFGQRGFFSDADADAMARRVLPRSPRDDYDARES